MRDSIRSKLCAGKRASRRELLKLAVAPTTANVASQVTAAKHPKSEDIVIYTNTTGGAEGPKAREIWVSTLGHKMQRFETRQEDQ